MNKSPLTSAERHFLWEFVRARYVASGLGDKAFAELAVKELGILNIRPHHVYTARETFGLACNTTTKAPPAISTEALIAIEQRLARIEKHLQALWVHLNWFPNGEVAKEGHK